MVYVELRSFLSDTFKATSIQIMEKGFSHCKIVDIDQASKEDKKKFANYILKFHLNFSPQKNRYLYDQLLKVLGIGSMFDIRDYRHTVEKVKKEENIVLVSVKCYWEKISQAYKKYEVILNLFWLKGVEAETKGADKDYVRKIINKALVSVRSESENAFKQLMKDLDLNKYIPHDIAGFKIHLFEGFSMPSQSKKPDEETRMILTNVTELKHDVDNVMTRLKDSLMSSIEIDMALRTKGQNDTKFMEQLKERIINEWTHLEESYEIKYKKLEEKFKPS